jgi:phage tail sheath protein FI
MQADVIVNAKVTSPNPPPSGQGNESVGIVAIVQKPLVDGKSIKVTSFAEAQRKLGTYLAESTAMYGIKKLFDKLGKVNVIVQPVEHFSVAGDSTSRVGVASSVTIDDGDATTPVSLIDVEANFFGKEGDNYAVEISNVDSTAKTYDVAVLYKDAVVTGGQFKGVTNTTFASLVKHPELTFTVLVNDNVTTPKAGKLVLAGGQSAHTGVTVADFEYALDLLKAKQPDFVLADNTAVTVGQKAVAVAGLINSMAYINTPNDTSDEEAITYRANFNSANGRLMHPHSFVSDPIGTVNAPNKAIPITYEAVANQILAYRQVGRRQVSAGETYGKLDVLGLTHQPDGDMLTDSGVNFALEFEASSGVNGGVFIWDATTLSNNADWADLNRIQLLNFVRKGLVPALRPDLFKSSDPTVWNATRTRCDMLMNAWYKAGEFFGDTPADAYFVQVDEDNNPREEQQAKRMHVKVGYKDKYMIKWVVLDLEIA